MKVASKKIKTSWRNLFAFAWFFFLVLVVLSHDHLKQIKTRENLERMEAPHFPAGTLRRRDDLNLRIRPDPWDKRKKITLNVRGQSMQPELQPGDRIVAYIDSDLAEAEVGQLVTYIADLGQGQESYYTHKIVEIREDAGTGERVLVTRGVSNRNNDITRVTRDNFIGLSRKL